MYDKTDPLMLNGELIDQAQWLLSKGHLDRLDMIDEMRDNRLSWRPRYSMNTTNLSMTFWNHVAQLQG